jgi:magnesium-transporting ATPase (P-type)
MLTGDKIETAICIAQSTGLKTKNERKFIMKNLDNERKI